MCPFDERYRSAAVSLVAFPKNVIEMMLFNTRGEFLFFRSVAHLISSRRDANIKRQ